MSLKGKTAVVTGSNSGIGLGIAWELARAGADVVLNSFSDTEEDHALAREMAAETGVKVRADRTGGQMRYPGEQRGHSACGPD
jgi:3-hydroxybutyrate dehydrogenase